MEWKKFYNHIVFNVDSRLYERLTMKQGDSKSRGLYVTVMQNGVVVEDLSGLTMQIIYAKPDETGGILDAQIVDGVFRVDYSDQMNTVAGEVKCELLLAGSSEEKIYSKTFEVIVDESVVNNGLVSKSERGILDRAFELAEDIIPRLELLDIGTLETIGVKYPTLQGVEDDSVTPEMASFFDVSPNEFDKDSIEMGKSIDTDGSILDDPIRWLTGHIPVKDGDTLYINNPDGLQAVRLGLYKGDKEWFSRSGFRVLDGRLYYDFSGYTSIRISSNMSPERLMLTRNTEVVEYDEHGIKVIPREYLDIPAFDSEQIEADLDENKLHIEEVRGKANRNKDAFETHLMDYRNQLPKGDFTLTNLLTNGGFKNGDDYLADGWFAKQLDIDGGFVYYDSLENAQYINTIYYDGHVHQKVPTIKGHIYYICCKLKKKLPDRISTLAMGVGNGENGTGGSLVQTTRIPDEDYGVHEFKHVSNRLVMQSNYERIGFAGFGGVPSNALLKDAMMIDLSEHYGTGNEPTIPEFYDNVISKIPGEFFEGDYTLGKSIRESLLELDERIDNLPIAGDIDEDRLIDLINRNIPTLEPSFPKLTWETVEHAFQEVFWLSEDGKFVYGRQGAVLLQSIDEWETTQRVAVFDTSVQGVRTLSDGELLVSTLADEDSQTPCSLYKSSGYNKEYPNDTQFVRVLQTGGMLARFANQWGFNTYENIVIMSEYGLKTSEGARRVYLSTDNGDNFKEIYDLHTTKYEGRPDVNPISAHIHSAVYDPYYNRIWVVNGDGPRDRGCIYSDDMGNTWKRALIEGNRQVTSIIALPDSVIFGSDNPTDNGVYVYRRKDKLQKPVIKTMFLMNDSKTMTNVFQLSFKRDWSPYMPVYMTATPVQGSPNSTIIIGLVDGKKAHILYTADGSDGYSNLLNNVIGPTEQGNLMGYMVDADSDKKFIVKAKAPIWS